MKLGFFIFLITGCAHMNDSYLWLEDVESEKSLAWVKAQNNKSDEYFLKNPYYEKDKANYEKILLADDRLIALQIRDEYFYNVWQDQKSKLGIFRRIKIQDYVAHKDNWQNLIDLDQLSAQENKKWYISQYRFLDHSKKILISLSNGGTDAVVWREYDLEKKSFIKDGFELPESKSDLTWYNENTVVVRDALSEGSRSQAGYAKHIRLWQRGQKFADSKIIFTIQDTDMSAQAEVDQETKNFLILQFLSFTSMKTYLLKDLETLLPVDLPIDIEEPSFFHDRLYVRNLKDWLLGTQKIKAGSLISWPVKDISPTEKNIQVHFEPTATEILQSYNFTKNILCLTKLKNIKTLVDCFDYQSAKWNPMKLSLPQDGVLQLMSASPTSDHVLWHHADFLKKPELILSTPKKETQLIKTIQSKFREDFFKTEQLWAISRDGTKIPYFVVAPKNMQLNSKNPVMMTGYGGFELPSLPHYLSATGKVWLEDINGVYVLANIRGGGEFGPAWHQSAILENKQKSYDDFIAVAEDLIHRKITSSEHLSIHGGSNGGLLVAAVALQRPELFKAVVCTVPLLDMLRYNKLLAGASWMAEFGNPDIPEQKTYIEKYSPYQNLKKNQKYPEFFFYTSTKDDRVHPGHARKMAAKMIEYGIPITYFEKSDGGHNRSTGLQQAAELYSKFTAFAKEKIVNSN
jgi:prolyl oligopeptidase